MSAGKTRPSRGELDALRSRMALAERQFSHNSPAFFLGGATDETLRAGLARGALHEIYPRRAGDAPAASGFALSLAIRAAAAFGRTGKGEDKPILWIRQDFLDGEFGALNGAGLRQFGIDPARLILVRVRDIPGALRAVEEAAHCPSLGAAIIETWGESKALDLTASRRLGLAAGDSGVTLAMVRPGAQPQPSAAATRWSVAAAPSVSPGAGAPGKPSFDLSLLRHRGGASERTWRVEWDRDRHLFADAPLSRSLVPASAGEPLAQGERLRTG